MNYSLKVDFPQGRCIDKSFGFFTQGEVKKKSQILQILKRKRFIYEDVEDSDVQIFESGNGDIGIFLFGGKLARLQALPQV